MRNFIATSAEKLIIKEFENISFKQVSVMPAQPTIFELISVVNNVKDNGCYYLSRTNETEIYGFLAGIGRQEHPLIEVSYASSWFNSNLGGIYLIGFDKMNNELFAPIPQKK